MKHKKFRTAFWEKPGGARKGTVNDHQAPPCLGILDWPNQRRPLKFVSGAQSTGHRFLILIL